MNFIKLFLPLVLFFSFNIKAKENSNQPNSILTKNYQCGLFAVLPLQTTIDHSQSEYETDPDKAFANHIELGFNYLTTKPTKKTNETKNLSFDLNDFQRQLPMKE